MLVLGRPHLRRAPQQGLPQVGELLYSRKVA